MKLLVCGARNYSDHQSMYRVLGELCRKYDVTEVIHGGAKGADTMAADWAMCFGLPVRRFMADWETYGKAAGPVRNKRMLTEGKPDLVVAFPTGRLRESRGTRNMVTQAVNARVEVLVVDGATLTTHDGHVIPDETE